MDNRTQSESDALKTMIKRMGAGMRMAIPAKVTSFDVITQMVTAVPVIRKIQTIDGVKKTIEMPPVINVPMVFPHGQTAGFALTVPILPGDTVLLIIADRSIDKWVEFSGIQDPVESVESRAHDITDSLAIVGATPNPVALANYQTDGIELRNKDRSMSVKVTNNKIVLTAGSKSFTMNKDGNITTDADITTTGDVIAGTISLKTHVHGGVQSGGSNTGGPQ